MRMPIWVIVWLAVSTPSCGESSSPAGPSSTTVKFSGRVIQYQTELPAVGAVVRFTLGSSAAPSFASETTTGAEGVYVLTVARTGGFTATVDGVLAGTAQVNGTAFPGDLYVIGGRCVARYGLVIDSRTLRPIGGATVSLSGRSTPTDSNGWYRLDLGCPEVTFPAGTTFIAVTHPDYQSESQVTGRGVTFVRRLDFDLDRR